ncbi:MAG TPA: hypothetical protein VFT74_15960 [Isosphaeraceae bacterium]|nr:hypothetical protein [Isosphaeraceae bacterium]
MPKVLTKRPTIPLEYAGKWIAWAADGYTIVASGDTLKACEKAAVRAGHALNEVAIHRVPKVHQRVDEKTDR